MTPETLSLRPVDVDPREIHVLLMSLWIATTYIGFYHCAYAVYIATQSPDCLLLVSKWLYHDVATHFGTSWRHVECNIRTASKIAWETNPALVNHLAGYELAGKPKTAHFISILAFHFLNNLTSS